MFLARAQGQDDLQGPPTHLANPRPSAYSSLTGRLLMAMHAQLMFHLRTAKQLSSPTHYLIRLLRLPPPHPPPPNGKPGPTA